ncbi:C4-type zinc ribbon domain-containing protein [Humibacillus xanthopallidus]
MKADPSRQWRLLDLQAIDTRLDQIAHARTHLPQLPAIEAARRELTSLDTDIVNARTTAGDVRREVAKSEQDVQLVRDRAARNQARLDSGQGSAKDLQALQHELASLARRQSELEDLELEVMERSESLDARVVQLDTQREELATRLSTLESERDAVLADLAAEEAKVGAGRADIVAGIGDELAALYEKIRASSGGLAAAELKHRRCGGCRLELNNVDLARIRAAAQDEVVRCEECRRIMIRTAESGL